MPGQRVRESASPAAEVEDVTHGVIGELAVQKLEPLLDHAGAQATASVVTLRH